MAAWQRERPDLDVAPLEVLSRVTRLSHYLDRARQSAFAEHHLHTWEFDVLSALRRAGAPYRLSPGQLGAQNLVTSGTMTNRVDRLAQRELVRRLPDPHDRRGVLVELSAAGLHRVDAAFERLLDYERQLLGQLPPSDQRALAALLHRITGHFEQADRPATSD